MIFFLIENNFTGFTESYAIVTNQAQQPTLRELEQISTADNAQELGRYFVMGLSSGYISSKIETI